MSEIKISVIAVSVLFLCSCSNSADTDVKGSTPKTEQETVTAETEEVHEETQPVTEKDTSYSESDGYFWEGQPLDFHEYIAGIIPQPPLWRVYDPETHNEIYLMGTIHSSCGYTFPLDDTVNEIYENSDGIAVEYDVKALNENNELKQEYFSYMKYSDGTGIQDHIPHELYERAREYLESQGRYSDVLEEYNTAYWYNAISSLPLSRIDNLSSVGVEAEFIEKARKDKKDVMSIETLRTQADAIAGYSDELAEYFIESTLGDFNEYSIVLNLVLNFANTYNFWIIGNDESMYKIFENTFDIPDRLESDYEEYEDKLLYSRNRHMAETAEKLLKEGKNYLFMVGSLHYAGEQGVDNILAEMGYEVEELS